MVHHSLGGHQKGCLRVEGTLRETVRLQALGPEGAEVVVEAEDGAACSGDCDDHLAGGGGGAGEHDRRLVRVEEAGGEGDGAHVVRGVVADRGRDGDVGHEAGPGKALSGAPRALGGHDLDAAG